MERNGGGTRPRRRTGDRRDRTRRATGGWLQHTGTRSVKVSAARRLRGSLNPSFPHLPVTSTALSATLNSTADHILTKRDVRSTGTRETRQTARAPWKLGEVI